MSNCEKFEVVFAMILLMENNYEIKLDFLACGHFTDNNQSKRVQEKCGFVHYRLVKHETRYGIVKDSWLSILENK